MLINEEEKNYGIAFTMMILIMHDANDFVNNLTRPWIRLGTPDGG